MSWYEELDRWTADYLPDMIYEHDAALAKYTSFRIGGPARRMAFPKDGSQMVLLIEAARGCGARPLVIGNGTNLLFPDEGVDRLVVNTRDMSCVVLDAEGRVTAEAGVPLARAAVFAQKQGLTGLEFAHGIPGSVGGAVCMNAGAYGGEMQQVVHSATVLFPDDGVRTLRGEELRFSYRHSLLTDRPEAALQIRRSGTTWNWPPVISRPAARCPHCWRRWDSCPAPCSGGRMRSSISSNRSTSRIC